MQRSSVPFVIGVWLVVGGVLLALGNSELTRQVVSVLVPLSLIAMGLWAIVRASRLHRLEVSLPRGVFLSELALAVVLILVHQWLVALRPVLRFYPEVASARSFPAVTSTTPLTTPLEELPKQPKWVIIQQATNSAVHLDVRGSDSFAIVEGSQNIRAFSPNAQIVRLELIGQIAPAGTEIVTRLKIPRTANLEVRGTNFTRLLVQDMEGDVFISYGGANPIVSVATKGNITVRQIAHPYYSHPYTDELLLFPGPNSQVTVNAVRETVRIFAQEPPQKGWQVRLNSGEIEVRLPSNSSVQLRATTVNGTVQAPFGQGQWMSKLAEHSRHGSPTYWRWYEHTGKLRDGKVPINLSITQRGSITVVLTR
ncbi:hypothetical protein [Fervidibacter sacchari]